MSSVGYYHLGERHGVEEERSSNVTLTCGPTGLFDTFIGYANTRAKAEDRPLTFAERGAAGLTAGGLAAVVGNPADLALIRMQADGLRPIGERANYSSVFDALGRIARNEGVLALWAGCFPTVLRAMALNFGQLAFFSEAKAQLSQRHVVPAAAVPWAASAVAGFFASFFSLPFDFVKTRLQNQRRGPDGMFPSVSGLDITSDDADTAFACAGTKGCLTARSKSRARKVC